MKMPSKKFLAINVASFLIVASAAATQLQSFLNPPTLAACPARYARSIEYGVQHAGVLLTASDIQAVSAGADIGVMENLTIQRLKNAPTQGGFAVALSQGTAQPTNPKAKSGGVSFPWNPRGLPQNVTSACLSYNIFLPADFDFGGGGSLPGLFGVSPTEGAALNEKFATHLVWTVQGKALSHIMLSTDNRTITDFTAEDAREALPRGRWVRIDQEVVLNTPQVADGRVRVWVDGTFRGENAVAAMRFSRDVSIQGVLVDVHFGGQLQDGHFGAGKAVKNEQVHLTPFELRWN